MDILYALSYHAVSKKNRTTYFRTYVPTENNAMTPDNLSKPIFLAPRSYNCNATTSSSSSSHHFSLCSQFSTCIPWFSCEMGLRYGMF